MGSIWNSDYFLFKAGSLKGKSREEIDAMKDQWKNANKKKKVSLSEWETNFIKGVLKQKSPLSSKQKEILIKIKKKNNSQTI
jgi:hypothetical protein